MTRPYFMVHGADLVTHYKWRRADPVTRGAILTLWALGSVKSDEARWPSLSKLACTLREEGFADEGLADALVADGWLEVDDDGQVSVHDWRSWQPDLPKSGAQRTRDWRDRAAGSGETGRDTRDGTASPSSPASLVTLGEERRGEDILPALPAGDEPEGPALTWLASHGAAVQPNGNGLHRKVIALVERHGLERVIATMVELGEQGSARAYVFGADNRLNPIPAAGRRAGPPTTARPGAFAAILERDDG